LLKRENTFLLCGALEGSEGGSNRSRERRGVSGLKAEVRARTWLFVKEHGA